MDPSLNLKLLIIQNTKYNWISIMFLSYWNYLESWFALLEGEVENTLKNNTINMENVS